MQNSRSIRALAVLLLSLLVPSLAVATCQAPFTPPGSSSVYMICLPAAGSHWDLVVYAHGYVNPFEPVGIPYSQLVLGGISIPDLMNSLGFAFAVTSYPKNGLAIKEGIQDVRELVQYFGANYYHPGRVYLAGVSEGGLVTAKAIEQYPSEFSGGLALCGPVGDFRKQINHFGDVRVLFDYFFPNVLPASPVSIPGSLIAGWESTYAPAVAGALVGNPYATAQLLKVAGVPTAPATAAETVLGNLWYNVFATNEAQVELGGQPYGNRGRWYWGSQNDLALNLLVQRFTASPTALAEISAYYQTTGKLSKPLVTMHTTGDPVVPYWQETIYGTKVLLAGSLGNYVHLPVVRYGHCAFDPAEVLFGFAVLVGKSSGQPLAAAERALPTPTLREKFRMLGK